MDSSPSEQQKEAEIAPPLKPIDVLAKRNLMDRWELTTEELTELVDANPSMRGMMFGYVAEYMLMKKLRQDPRVSELGKDDDHDRKNKGDLKFKYRERKFRLEVKKLQTNSIHSLGWDTMLPVDTSIGNCSSLLSMGIGGVW